MRLLLAAALLSSASLASAQEADTSPVNVTPVGQAGQPGSASPAGPNPMAGPVVAYPPTPIPKPAGNFIGLSTPNGRIAWNFVDLWFNQKKEAEAFDRYVARRGYMNHSFISKSTPQSFESQKAAEARAIPPAARFVFKQVIAQGDLVFLHIHAIAAPGTVGDEMVMVLRIRNGKIVDHWDQHTPLSADSNVFEGLDRPAAR